MVTSPAMIAQKAEAFDKLLDVIAEEVVERYLAEIEELNGTEPDPQETTA